MMSRATTILRIGAVGGALVCALTGPPILQAIFGLAALVNVADLVARLVAPRDLLERWLVAAMGVLVLAIVLGLVLNALPGQLSRTNWVIGWAVVGALGIVATERARPAGAASVPLPALVSIALLGVALAGAYALAWRGVHRVFARPLLALSSPSHGIATARVLVQSVSVGGTYAIRVLPDGRVRRGLTAATVQLSARHAEAMQRTIDLPPAQSHWVIDLAPAGQPRVAERQIILWKQGVAG